MGTHASPIRRRVVLFISAAILSLCLLGLGLATALADSSPSITSFDPTAGYPGIAVTITGNNLTGALEVDFNLTAAACYTVDSDTQITAVVPRGATTGRIRVKTPAGTAVSADEFVVLLPGPGRIAFQSKRDGDANIFVMNPDGSEETRLTTDPNTDTAPAFSPDGRFIAFCSDRDAPGHPELYRMLADGSDQVRLTSFSKKCSSPAFSPDGRRIAFVSGHEGNQEIYLINQDGSGLVRLTNNPAADSAPAFSPDGRKIAFVSTRDAVDGDIYAMNADGSGVTRLAVSSGLNDPDYNPTGTKIVFSLNLGAHTDLWRMNADGSSLSAVTSRGAGIVDACPSHSPDGTRLACASSAAPGGILVMNVDGSGEVHIGSDASDTHPSWGGELMPPPTVTGFSPTEGCPGTAVTLTGRNFSTATAVRFDMKPAICWTIDADNRITAVVPVGATTGLIHVTASGGIGDSADPFTVLPAGAGHIAFTNHVSGYNRIYVSGGDGGGLRALTADGENNYSPAFSPDGSRIVFVSSRGGSDAVYVMNADGSGQTRLTGSSAADASPCFSPDGRRIAFVSTYGGSDEIYLMNTDGSGLTRLTTSPGADNNPAFSPDGQWIAFLSERDGNAEIYRMHPDGSGLARLTDNPAVDGIPVYSPDGSFILFTSLRSGHAQLHLMNSDGTGVIQLTFAGTDSFDACFSPDGRKIAYTSTLSLGGWTRRDIHLMNRDGSGDTPLLAGTHASEMPSWGGGLAEPPVIDSFAPSAGYPGLPVTIRGDHFQFASQVAFNGVPAICWTTDTDLQITAVVPFGASTGPISVRNADGTADSSGSFLVVRPGPGRIAFSHLDANWNICAVDPTGEDLTPISPGGNKPYPAISPDGRSVAYVMSDTSDRFQIFVANIDGSAQTQLTSTGSNILPSFSPDGRKLVFVSTRDGGGIYVMNADGSGQACLVSGVFATDPKFSPDGRKIVYANYLAGNFDIYWTSADGGGGGGRLTTGVEDERYPTFTREGSRIVYSKVATDGLYHLFSMNAGDGADVRQLTSRLSNDLQPVVSPDNRTIAYASSDGGTYQLWKANMDGSGETRVTTPGTAANDQLPSWAAGPLPLPVISGFTPDHGYPGTTVTITGENFDDVLAVVFGSQSALCWTRDSSTQITAVVPRGAATGPISVITVADTAVSLDPFTVDPAGGGKIAFRSNRSGYYDIYVMYADGSVPRNLTGSAADDSHPSFSPDGTKIVYCSNPDGIYSIYCMNSDGVGHTRLTTPGPGENDIDPVFSPDGRKIAFASTRGGTCTHIYLMNADGTGLARLTDTTDWDGLPAFSPDGTQIAFYRNSALDGSYHIYRINSDGSGLTALTTSGDNFAPTFSPDGARIVFNSRRGEDTRFDVYVMNADGSAQTRLTHEGVDGVGAPPVFSPDGSQIAFASSRDGDFEIFSMNADGSAQAPLTVNTASDTAPNWVAGPDDRPAVTGFMPAAGHPGTTVTITGRNFTGVLAVVFGGQASTCWTVDSPSQITAVVPLGAITGPISVITATETVVSADAFTVTLPGTGVIVFTSNRDGNEEIYRMRADGSGQTRLTNNAALDEMPCLSPDGNSIVFVSNRDGDGAVYRMNADGSGQTRLTDGSYSCGSAAFSPDGRSIVFMAAHEGNCDIFLMNADGTGIRRLTTNPDLDQVPKFSPDGRRITFAAYHADHEYISEIYVMNADGSGLTRLTHSSANAFSPAFSPDGGKIVFASAAAGNYDIYSMNADGTGLTRLTTNPGEDSSPAFSPDGASIVFHSNRSGNLDLYTMKPDGSAQTRLTSETSDEILPYWGTGVPAPISGVTLAADPANVPMAGNDQCYHAAPVDGIVPEYAFRVQVKDIHPDRSYSWVTVYEDTAFHASPDCTFTAADPGAYTIAVTARETGVTTPVVTKTVTASIGTDTLTGVSLAANMTSGVALSDIPAAGIRLTATPTGTGAGVTYFFLGTLRDLDAAGAATSVPVTLSGDYGGTTFQWHPTEPGYYTLRVIARDATCNVSYSGYLTFLVRSGSLKGLIFTANPLSGTALNVLPAGGITLTGTPQGTGIGVEYFFSGILKTMPDGAVRNEPIPMSTEWSTARTFAWHPTEPGVYQLTLTARDSTYNTSIAKTMNYVLRLAKLVGIVSLTAVPPSGVAEVEVPAEGIAFTTLPNPTNASLEYFYAAKRRVYRPDGSFTDTPVTMSTAYQASPLYSWHPSQPGMYLVTVTVRDTIYWITSRTTVSYLIKPASLTGFADFTAAPASGLADDGIPAGGVTLTATPQGSGAGARYFFSAKLKDIAADGSYVMTPVTLSTTWGSSRTFAWHPTAPGTYTLTVTAKDADGVVTFTRNLAYTLKSATVTGITAFTPNMPTGTLLANIPAGGVVFTAAITGTGTGVLYRCQVSKYNGSTYDLEPMTDYTTANTFAFHPTTTGTYRIWVYAYDSTYNTSYFKYTGFVVN